MNKGLITAAVLGTASLARAQGLDMCYDITDLGNGQFRYTFSLSPDAGWAPGMGWRWLVFGDVPREPSGASGTSPIRDFSMDPTQFPIGPWTHLTSSGGGHSGPTFAEVLDYWVPASRGETLRWTGVSRNAVAPGELLFSTLAGTLGGAVAADFRAASTSCRVCPCSCDFDQSTGPGVCDIFDFLAFQHLFVTSNPCACDLDTTLGLGVCDLFDFLAFQNGMVAGCP